MQNPFTKKTEPKTNHPTGVTKKLIQGFTMIEMLTVLAIFTVMTSVVLYQYGQFNSQTIMTNMAYEVALATRQAQVFSLGVRGQSGIDNFDNRYGVYFNLDVSDGKKDFVFFIDYGEEDSPESANSICDDETTGQDGSGNCFACVGDTECLEKFSLSRDIVLDRICLSEENDPLSDNVGTCDGVEVSQATITFERPNPDAIIQNAEDVDSDDPYTSAAVILSTKFGNQRAVVIKNTGQITVEVLADK